MMYGIKFTQYFIFNIPKYFCFFLLLILDIFIFFIYNCSRSGFGIQTKIWTFSSAGRAFA